MRKSFLIVAATLSLLFMVVLAVHNVGAAMSPPSLSPQPGFSGCSGLTNPLPTEEFQKAAAAFQKRASESPQDAQVLYDEGKTFASQKRYEEAISFYTKAVQLKPDFWQAYEGRGHVQKQFDLAVQDFTKSIELNPADANAYLGRGATYFVRGHYDQALADLQKSLSLSQTDKCTCYYLGRVYESMGNGDAALVNYGKALEIDPSFASALWYRAKLYSGRGESEKASADQARLDSLAKQPAE